MAELGRLEGAFRAREQFAGETVWRDSHRRVDAARPSGSSRRCQLRLHRRHRAAISTAVAMLWRSGCCGRFTSFRRPDPARPRRAGRHADSQSGRRPRQIVRSGRAQFPQSDQALPPASTEFESVMENPRTVAFSRPRRADISTRRCARFPPGRPNQGASGFKPEPAERPEYRAGSGRAGIGVQRRRRSARRLGRPGSARAPAVVSRHRRRERPFPRDGGGAQPEYLSHLHDPTTRASRGAGSWLAWHMR